MTGHQRLKRFALLGIIGALSATLPAQAQAPMPATRGTAAATAPAGLAPDRVAVIDRALQRYVDGPTKSFAGGAGLLSTARDYARFLEAMRRGGTLDGVRILGSKSVRLMSTNQVGTLRSGNGLGFGLGFETTDRYGASGMSSAGSFGWGGAYGSFYRVDPDERLVLVLMIQLIPNGTDVREVFPTLIYQALE